MLVFSTTQSKEIKLQLLFSSIGKDTASLPVRMSPQELLETHNRLFSS